MLSLNSFSQSDKETSRIDFGFVDRFHNRLADTYLVNTSDAAWDLLRWDKESTIDLKVSSRKVDVGDTLHIRLKLNPIVEGPYTSEVKLIFGRQEHLIEIKANIRFVDLSSNTPCPDFDKTPGQLSEDWKAGFKVLDKVSKEPIPEVTLRLQGMKGEAIELKTDKQGIAEAPMAIDYYTVQVLHKGYATFQLETYINRHQNELLIELTPGRGAVVVRRPGSGVDIKQEEVLATKVNVEAEVPANESLPSEEKTASEFDEKLYRLNNITFLIDISTSMRQGHKMEILRASLNALVEMLRVDDRVSIITYASSTDVLGSGMSGGEKTALHDMITGLEAEGLTAGEAGLKKAYGLSKKYYIEQGNNQVFLITDGALQKGYEKVLKLASDRAEKGINLSVIAIDANKWAQQKMQSLAEQGQGKYLAVDSETEAQNQLKESIKEQSRIHH